MSDECNHKVEELRKDCKNGFSFKVKPILNLNQLYNIKKFEGFFCETTFAKFLYQTKGIIYLQNCSFNEELKKKKRKNAYHKILIMDQDIRVKIVNFSKIINK